MAHAEVKAAVILAAGNGSRLRPFTNFIPKTMVPYRDKPLIYHHIMNCYNNGIKDIIVVTRKDEDNNYSFKVQNEYLKDLERELKSMDKEIKIKLVYQEEDKNLKKPRGPATALAMAEDELKGKSYIALLGDNLIVDKYGNPEGLMRELLDTFEGYPVYYVENLEKKIAKNCGFVKGNKSKRLEKILIDTEEAAEKPSDEVIKEKFGLKDRYDVISGGMYIFNEESMYSIKNVQPGTNNETHLTDAINDQIKNGGTKAFGVLFPNSQYTAIDFGTPESWLSVNLKKENVGAFKKAIDNYSQNLRELIHAKVYELFNTDIRKLRD